MNGEIIKTEQCSPNGFTGPHSQGIRGLHDSKARKCNLAKVG